jgi:peptidoglycan/LPS O-acetylase OafA/YrhL
LRGVAALLVLLFHFEAPGFSHGYLGVDLFFALSGFLITVLLVEEARETGRIDLPAFYRRRALRLFPALGVLLLLLTFYAYVLRPAGRGIPLGSEILAAALYVTNWLTAFGVLSPRGILSHTWTLSIEEQFYLSWPLIFLLGCRGGAPRRGLLWTAAALALASAACRLFLLSRGGEGIRAYFGLDTRADELLIGCVAGLLVSTRPPLGRSRTLRVLGGLSFFCLLLAASGLLMSHGSYLPAGVPLAALGTVGVIASVTAPGMDPLRSVLEAPPLVWIGKISYGLYLWHMIVAHAFLKSSWMGRWWTPAAGVGASIAVAAGSYVLVERPFLRLRRRPTLPGTRP